MMNVELKYHDIEPPLCWKRIFGNAAPVEIEIGFGKCGFLINIATAYSQRNFLGIEVSRKYYRKGVRKIERAELNNVKLLLGEALHVCTRYIPDASVTNIYINFPDPWPKKRHAKRRLIKAEFLTVAAQKLVPAGSIVIATDVPAYMEDTIALFQANEQYGQVSVSTNRDPNNPRQHRSDYEQGFIDEGKIIYYAEYRKRD